MWLNEVLSDTTQGLVLALRFISRHRGRFTSEFEILFIMEQFDTIQYNSMQHCDILTLQSPQEYIINITFKKKITAQIKAKESTKVDAKILYWTLLYFWDNIIKVNHMIKVQHYLAKTSDKMGVQTCRAAAPLSCCSIEFTNSRLPTCRPSVPKSTPLPNF